MSRRLLSKATQTSATTASGKSPKPSADNAGVWAVGGPTLTWSGGTSVSTSNTIINGYTFSSDMTFTGTNVTIRNCLFEGGVTFALSDGVLVEDSSVKQGISIASVYGATFRRVDIDGTSGDMVHITGDRPGRNQCKNITFEDSFIHGPEPANDDHNDGMQVRGCDGLTLTRTVIDMGPWIVPPDGDDALNAAFFLEPANGGNENITLTDCWMNGAGITLRCFGNTGTFSITGLKIGTDYRYGIYTGDTTPTQSGNSIEGTNGASSVSLVP